MICGARTGINERRRIMFDDVPGSQEEVLLKWLE
jgi:hypothetical protein